jgi:hypothetical protein
MVPGVLHLSGSMHMDILHEQPVRAYNVPHVSPEQPFQGAGSQSTEMPGWQGAALLPAACAV